MSPKGPAGLSRLRLPIAPPGRVGLNGRPAGSGQEDGTHARGRVAREAVGDDDSFDHVGDDIAERPRAHEYRDDRAAREPADRARGSGATRRCAERRHDEAGRPSCRAEAAGNVGEPNHRHAIHRPY